MFPARVFVPSSLSETRALKIQDWGAGGSRVGSGGAPRVPCSEHVGPGMCMRDKRLVRNPEGISFSRADKSRPKSHLPTPGALLPCFPPVSGSPRVPESLFPAPSCGRWAGGSLGGSERPPASLRGHRLGPGVSLCLPGRTVLQRAKLSTVSPGIGPPHLTHPPSCPPQL